MQNDAPLWRPSAEAVARSKLSRFAAAAEAAHGIGAGGDYRRLHRWSVTAPEQFWTTAMRQLDLLYQGSLEPVRVPSEQPPGARWFPNVNLNYAQNLLRWPGEWTALIEAGEAGIGDSWSFAELRARVALHQQALRRVGVCAGDTVAGILPNAGEACAAALAAASIGAAWCSVSPDFGAASALDRLGQVRPAVLYAAAHYRYGGKPFGVIESVREVARGLEGLRLLVRVGEHWTAEEMPGEVTLEQFLAHSQAREPEFLAVPFQQPLFVLFTSGTTGAPKCIVHSHGGTLLQLAKEHQLHCDLRPQDRMIFPSTLGWMMWNWSLSALASGATIVLYEGALAWPDDLNAFRIADTLGVSLLGLPSAFLERCRQVRLKVHEQCALKDLRMLFAGGSILSAEAFRYIYEDVAPDTHLASSSGGTDIISCFIASNPWGPVWAGELQAPALGMDVKVFDESGTPVVGEQGELVCTSPAPSMPVRFANDPAGKRYRASYFERFPGVWTHGDFAEETAHGGFVIHGRSDAVLNPGGVRIGTAEIYRHVRALPQVADCVAVGQEYDGDVRVVLFVSLVGEAQLDDTLRAQIRDVLRRNASPRHVPKVVLQVPDVPRTRNGKIAETAVKAVIHGREPSQIHALGNPEVLAHFKDRPELAT
jgi:acetoacetyl-CoA synthetase